MKKDSLLQKENLVSETNNLSNLISDPFLTHSNYITEFIELATKDHIEPKEITQTLKILIDYFNISRINCYLFAKHSSESLILLCKLYLDPSIEKENIEMKKELFQALNSIHSKSALSIKVYEFIYKSLSQYYHSKDLYLNEPTLFRHLLLLKVIYDSPILSIEKPKSCFYFCGNSQINVKIPKNNQIKLLNGLFISITFRILKNYNISTDDKSVNLIKMVTEKMIIELIILKDNTLSLKIDKEIKTSINVLPADQWINLSLNISSDSNRTLTIKINQSDPFSYSLNYIGKASTLNELYFFQNVRGEALSMTVIDRHLPFNMKNCFYNAPKGKNKILSLKTLKESINIEQVIIFLTPINSFEGRQIIDDLFGKYQVELINECGIHKAQSFRKRISLIGGVNMFLPIIELILMNNICTEKVFLAFLDVIKVIIKCSQYNKSNAIDNDFFLMLSIFIEKIPNDFFQETILKKLLEILEVLIDTPKLLTSYFHEIILNEVILFKFPSNLHKIIWEIVSKMVPVNINLFLVYCPIPKLLIILRKYDALKYKEYCCQTHYDSFIHPLEDKHIIMSPSLNEKATTLMDLINLILSKIKLNESFNEPLTIFEFLSFDLSPCLTKLILKLFINFYTHKDVYIKFKSAELASKTKFYHILSNLLSVSLPDVKCDILSLILLSHKKEKLNPILINGLKHFLLPSKAFYKPKSFGRINKGDIQELALHCKSMVENRDMSTISCIKFIEEDLILNQIENQKYQKSFYNFLIQFLFNKANTTDLFGEMAITSTSNIANEGVIEVLVDYSEKSGHEASLRLLKDFTKMFSNNLPNSFKCYSNVPLYVWIMKQMFKGFITQDQENELFILARDINNYLMINTIEQNKKTKPEEQKNPLNNYKYLFSYGAEKLDFGFNRNLINDFIRYVISNQFELLRSKITKPTSQNITDPYYRTIMELFAIIIDFMTLFNKKSYVDSSFFASTKSFPSVCFHALNVQELTDEELQVDKIRLLKDIWLDYDLFKSFYDYFNTIWDKSLLQPYGSKTRKEMIPNNEAYLGNLLLNKTNKNRFIDNIKTLEYVTSKEEQTTLGYNIIFCFGLILSIVKEESEADKWFEEYKNFVLFNIISISNLEPKIASQYIISHNRAIDLILFSMNYLTELSMVIFDKKKGMAISVLKHIFSLCCLIISALNEDDNKKTAFSGIFTNPIQALKETCAVKVFREILVFEGSPILSPIKISEIKRQEYMNIPILFTIDPWKTMLMSDNYILKKHMKMLNIDQFRKKLNKRFKCNDIKENDELFIKDIFMVLKETIHRRHVELCKWANISYESKKHKELLYRKQKKNMFQWTGSWADKNLYYYNHDQLKLKVINHLTRSFSHPILGVIGNIDYYLPEFSGFNKETLFKEYNDNYSINVNFDELCIDYENKKNELQNEFTLLYQIYSQSNKNLWKIYLKCIDQAILGKEDDLAQYNYILHQEIKPKIIIYQCCRIKLSHHIKGIFFLSSNELVFKTKVNQNNGFVNNKINTSYDYDNDRKTCFGSYFICHHKDKDHLTYTIPYQHIKYCFRRSYYHKHSALEFYLTTNKNILFNFETSQDRECIYKDLSQLFPQSNSLEVDPESNDDYKNIIGFEIPTNNHTISKRPSIAIKQTIDGWKKNEISNFDLLMYLNIFGNRSNLDLTQYPVFPWILTNYSTDTISLNNDIRDLSLPMGMLEINEDSKSRKEIFLESYRTQLESVEYETEEMTTFKPYMYGSHYSCPIYTVHFMMRLFPYSHISIELQGNHFDEADRLFYSIDSSFSSSSSQKTDLRELIPEVYYLPELFLNVNKLDMGILSSNVPVNDVDCPPWAKGEAHTFVHKLREYLENDRINETIGKWIDLVFGKKQRGKEAELANNVFMEGTYGTNMEILPQEQKLVNLKMVEFGLTPKQIFCHHFSTKTKSKDRQISNGEMKQVVHCNFPKILNQKGTYITGFKVSNDNTILLMFEDNDEYMYKYKENNNQITPKEIKKLDSSIKRQMFLGKMSQFYGESAVTTPLLIKNNLNHIIQAGFIDDKIIFTSFDNGSKENITIINSKEDTSSITAIEYDRNDNLIIAGNSEGRVNVYAFNTSTNNWLITHQLINNSNTITAIDYSSYLNIIATASNDGYINLYTMPLFKLFRSIHLKGKSCDFIVISSSPIACICVYSMNKKAFDVYSINGQFLATDYEEQIKSLILFADNSFNEYIIYIVGNLIKVRTIPTLKIVNEFKPRDIRNLDKINISEDKKTCYGVSKDGNELIVIKV